MYIFTQHLFDYKMNGKMYFLRFWYDGFFCISKYLKNPHILFNNEMVVGSGEGVMKQWNPFFFFFFGGAIA